jgi:hypothetical protein
MSNPLVINDPMAVYQTTKDVLESMEVTDIDLLLPKPSNQQPERIDDPYMENMFFLLPQTDRPFFDVFPDQDHELHLRAINELLSGLEQQQMLLGQVDVSEEDIKAIQLHKQKHTAYLYGVEHGLLGGQRQSGIMGADAGNQIPTELYDEQLSMGGEPSFMSIGESGAVPGTGGGFEGTGEIPGEGILERVPLDQRNTGYVG